MKGCFLSNLAITRFLMGLGGVVFLLVLLLKKYRERHCNKTFLFGKQTSNLIR